MKLKLNLDSEWSAKKISEIQFMFTLQLSSLKNLCIVWFDWAQQVFLWICSRSRRCRRRYKKMENTLDVSQRGNTSSSSSSSRNEFREILNTAVQAQSDRPPVRGLDVLGKTESEWFSTKTNNRQKFHWNLQTAKIFSLKRILAMYPHSWQHLQYDVQCIDWTHQRQRRHL